jgi:phosphoglycerate dehydrogenase-like enzyme
LVSEKLGDAGLEVLRSFGHVECLYGLSPDELCSKISSCDALIVRSGTKVSRQVLEASKGRLKVVGRAGVGIDNVDLQAATEFGCLVVNAPTANTVAAAEHGIALLTAMARNVAQADASMKAGKFLTHSCLLLNFTHTHTRRERERERERELFSIFRINCSFLDQVSQICSYDKNVENLNL